MDKKKLKEIQKHLQIVETHLTDLINEKKSRTAIIALERFQECVWWFFQAASEKTE